MTAREELLRNLRGYTPHEDMADDLAAQMLDAYRAEVLREAAARIRQGWDETRGATSASRVMAFAADLIDPTP